MSLQDSSFSDLAGSLHNRLGRQGLGRTDSKAGLGRSVLEQYGPEQYSFAARSFADSMSETFDKQLKLDSVKTIFRDYDQDQDGYLHQHEFESALEQCGFKLSQRDVGLLFDALDVDQNKKLSLKEFKQVVKKQVFRRRVKQEALSVVSFAAVVMYWGAVCDLAGGIPVEMIKRRCIDEAALDEAEGDGFVRARLIEMAVGFVCCLPCLALLITGKIDYSGTSLADDDDEEPEDERDKSKAPRLAMALLGHRVHIDRLIKFNVIGMLGAVAWLGLDLIFGAVLAWVSNGGKEQWRRLLCNLAYLAAGNVVLVATRTMSHQFGAGAWDDHEHVVERLPSPRHD